MADSFEVVSNRSWFSRIGSAIAGFFIGPLLILASVILLFWNEGRSVDTYKILKEGEGVVVSVGADDVDSSNDGKLVHVSGEVMTDAVLTDEDFGVSANAVRLRREVSMFQWEEKQESKTRKKIGGGEETVTTYTYRKAWSESLLESSNFHEPAGHENPREFSLESDSWDARDVRLGAFTLSPGLVAIMNDFSALPIREIPEGAEWPAGVSLDKGGIYVGKNPSEPQIGDLRIAYSEVKPGEASILAAQQGSTFQPYRTKAGGSIEMIRSGILDAREMFAAAHSENTFLTWILRGFGLLLAWAGFGLLFAPLSVLADFIPFLGNLVGAATGAVSFLLAVAVSFTVIAIAWIFFRPLLGLLLLAVAVAAVIGGMKFLRRKAQAA